MKWVLFYLCPNTGNVIKAFKGDKEVACRCGRSNPAALNERTYDTGCRFSRFFSSLSIPQIERTQETGSHLVRFLRRAYNDVILKSMDPSIQPLIAELFIQKPDS
jgi:hypothetical protein